ncbi:unnamed protein product [Rhodiola kirilowii]
MGNGSSRSQKWRDRQEKENEKGKGICLDMVRDALDSGPSSP